MSKERRQEIRIRSANLINYSRQAADAPGPRAAYEILGTAATRDLSATGCRLLASQPLPVGTELQLDFQLGEHLVSCQAAVVRVTKEGGQWSIGLEFEALDDMAQDGLRAYLAFKDDAEEA